VRRAVANNALSINDRRAGDAAASVTVADIGEDGLVKLSHGRKKHVLVKAV
jgi:tyrosyl-tRNA synthetase